MLEMLLGGGRKFVNPGEWVELDTTGGPTARTLAVAAGIDDKVYTFGGLINSPSTVYYNDLKCYDTTNGSWSTKAVGAPARNSAVGIAARGKFYIQGGGNGSGRLKDLWEYDPALNTWTRKADAPLGRQGAGGCAVDGLLYIAAGFSGTVYYNDLISYDIDTNLWGTLPSLPAEGRHFSAMTSIGTKLYLYGGRRGATTLNDLWCYDTVAGTWTQLASGPTVTGRYSHSMVAMGGKLYVHGGLTVAGWKGETFRYDPDTNEWAAMATLIPGHAIHYAAVCQDKMFIGTGQVASGSAGVVNDFWRYTPPL
mgnify:CR=1 FL=1